MERNLTLMLLCFFCDSSGWQYKEEIIVNATVFLQGFRCGQYSEEQILNVSLFLLMTCCTAKYLETDIDCYCVSCEFLAKGFMGSNWYSILRCLF